MAKENPDMPIAKLPADSAIQGRRIPLYRNEFRIQFGRDPNKRFHLYDVAIKVRMWSRYSEHKLCSFY